MRITVKLKLGLAFGIVIALSADHGLAWRQQPRIAEHDDGGCSSPGPVERMQLAQDMNTGLQLAIRGEKNLMLAGTDADARARADGEIVRATGAVQRPRRPARVAGDAWKARGGSPPSAYAASNGSKPATRSAR